MASKPGTCVKVLAIEPQATDPRLREDLALLADCALPPELRVSMGWGLRSLSDPGWARPFGEQP